MTFPERKPNRLKDHDYTQNGVYFITICTAGKRELFRADDTAHDGCAPLSEYGLIAENAILSIPAHYEGVTVDKYVVMPNHVHLLLTLAHVEGAKLVAVSTVVNQYKGAVTKRIGFPVWQKLYHDRIVRNDNEYLKIWQYIDENPLKWELDCFNSANRDTAKA